jgi:hypothetical protein
MVFVSMSLTYSVLVMDWDAKAESNLYANKINKFIVLSNQHIFV